MASKDFPVSLTIRAVDRATGVLNKIAFGAGQAMARVSKAGFGQNLTKAFAAAKFKDVFSGLKDVGGELFSLFAKLGALTGVAGFAFGSLVKGVMEAGDKLAEMADRTGLGVDAFASLQHAAALADVDQESFNGAMDQFNKRLGEAKAGGGSLLGFLNKVSPALANQVKGAKSTEAALSLMTDAFAKIEDPSKRAALASAAFGKSGLQMGAFLHQGSAAIQVQQAEFLRLKGSQEKVARTSGALDNALKNLNEAFSGLATGAFGELFPVFTKLAELVTEFIVKNRDGIQKWAEGAAKAIEAWIKDGGFERLVERFGKIFDTIKEVWDLVGGFKGALAIFGAFMAGPLVASIFSLFSSLVTLGPLLGTIGGAFFTALAAAGPFLGALLAVGWAAKVIWDNWEPLKAAFADLWESITWEFSKAWEKVRPIMDKVSDFFGITAGGLQVYKDGANVYQQATAPVTLPPNSVSSTPRQTEARVMVDFSNMPQGARVTQDKNSSQPVDVGLGYAMTNGGY